MGEKTIRLALRKSDVQTTTIFRDLWKHDLDKELISVGKFCLSSARLEWEGSDCLLYERESDGKRNFFLIRRHRLVVFL